jgi:hypothetical protein
MKSDTAKFTKVTILYDDGSFAIAKGIWDNEKEAMGARWYEEGGLGYPQTYGKPQWFIFPDDIGNVMEAVFSFSKLVKNVTK